MPHRGLLDHCPPGNVDALKYVTGRPGKINRVNVYGFARLLDLVRAWFALPCGVDQQARVKAGRCAVRKHLINVSMLETRRLEILVLGIANEYGCKLATLPSQAATKKSPASYGLGRRRSSVSCASCFH